MMKKNQQTTTQAGSGILALPACAAALLLLAAPAHAGSIKYEFTGGSLAPTATGLPAGVTVSDFSIGSFPGGALQSDALHLTGGDIGTNSTATSLANNKVLSFSITIPSDVTLDLTSLTFDYTSNGIGSTFIYARTFSSIDGHDDMVNDTIGLFGKASTDPATASDVTISLENPAANFLVGSNVTAADFTGLTNQTVTFYMPMIRQNGVTTGSIQFDNITLNIAGEPAGGGEFRLTITPAEAPATGYDLEWDSTAGKAYNLRTSTDLEGPISEWDILMANIYGTPPANLINVQADGARRFYAVEKFDAPPLLEENFENVEGPGPPAGWTRTDNGAGTVWEVGTPAGGAQFVPSAAVVGNQCAGTNINAQYTSNAEASLISPAFAVPESGAALSCWQYIDTEISPSGDLGSIRLLDAEGNFLANVVTGIEGITTLWSEQSIDLPAEANGLEVKLEFRFTSDAEVNWGGFYIDDVVVTAK